MDRFLRQRLDPRRGSGREHVGWRAPGGVPLRGQDWAMDFLRRCGPRTEREPDLPGPTTVESIPGPAGTPDFDVDGIPLTLRAGEAVQVRVRFHPSALGMRSNRFQLGTPVSASTQDVDVRGHAVRGLAQLSAESLDFGDVVLGKTVSLTFNLTNNDGHARTDVRIEPPSGPDASAFHSSREGAVSLGAEESATVQLDFTPARLGAAPATVQVTRCPT